MEELSIEQKALAYDKALERARELATDLPNGRNDRVYHVWDLESIFPELKESGDERIRKEIIATIHLYYGEPLEDEAKEMIAWLEKQGEQKSAWSEEDENGLSDALWAIQQARTIAKDENDMGNLWYAERWLKSLKNRVQLQSLWKPNDKQMADLWNMVCECRPADQQLLQDLYYELKTLRGE